MKSTFCLIAVFLIISEICLSQVYLKTDFLLPNGNVFLDKKENIWIEKCSRNQIEYYRIIDNIPVKVTENDGLDFKTTCGFYMDNSRNIWFFGRPKGLCKFDGNIFTAYTDVNANYTRTFIETTDSAIIVPETKKSWKYSNDRWTLYEKDFETEFRNKITSKQTVSFQENINGAIESSGFDTEIMDDLFKIKTINWGKLYNTNFDRRYINISYDTSRFKVSIDSVGNWLTNNSLPEIFTACAQSIPIKEIELLGSNTNQSDKKIHYLSKDENRYSSLHFLREDCYSKINFQFAEKPLSNSDLANSGFLFGKLSRTPTINISTATNDYDIFRDIQRHNLKILIIEDTQLKNTYIKLIHDFYIPESIAILFKITEDENGTLWFYIGKTVSKYKQN
jgi:hypothetical protein